MLTEIFDSFEIRLLSPSHLNWIEHVILNKLDIIPIYIYKYRNIRFAKNSVLIFLKFAENHFKVNGADTSFLVHNGNKAQKTENPNSRQTYT